MTEFNKAISFVEITNIINTFLLKDLKSSSDDVNLAAEERMFRRAAKKANLLKRSNNIKRKLTKE